MFDPNMSKQPVHAGKLSRSPYIFMIPSNSRDELYFRSIFLIQSGFSRRENECGSVDVRGRVCNGFVERGNEVCRIIHKFMKVSR
jgi:hypothetical protein